MDILLNPASLAVSAHWLQLVLPKVWFPNLIPTLYCIWCKTLTKCGISDSYRKKPRCGASQILDAKTWLQLSEHTTPQFICIKWISFYLPVGETRLAGE